ncbi:MAG: translation initiation factor Sui1 [SAR324 cluster bacterium]|nr:translation initiation factor Sui1 [SAR324 cluster bacterium]
MKSKDNRNEGLVYSTEFGKGCPTCGKPLAQCRCQQKKAGIPNDGIVRVGRETKGRKGSGVTVITGLPLEETALKKLATQLKQKCGTGGTLKAGVIEIQGDHRDSLMNELTKLGYTVKRSGG